MVNQSKLETLINIYFLFLARDNVTVKYIMERYNLNQRTVYRYLTELSLYFPIYKLPSNKQGYSLSKDYKLPSMYLTETEKETIINILQNINNETGSETIENIIDKLKAISKNITNNNVSIGNIIIDSSSWGNTSTQISTVTLIEKSIESCSSLLIEYVNSKGEKTIREIDPHTLLLKQGLWYCFAYCNLKNELRLFKISRITSIQETGKKFTRKNTSNLRKIIDDWYGTLEVCTIDLIFDKSIKSDIEEWLGIENTYKDSNGLNRVSINMPIDKLFISKLLSFGDKITVLSPKKLINDLKTLSLSILNLYK